MPYYVHGDRDPPFPPPTRQCGRKNINVETLNNVSTSLGVPNREVGRPLTVFASLPDVSTRCFHAHIMQGGEVSATYLRGMSTPCGVCYILQCLHKAFFRPTLCRGGRIPTTCVASCTATGTRCVILHSMSCKVRGGIFLPNEI